MNECIKIKDFVVYTWSLSGIETNIVVKKGPMKIAFDLGYATRVSVDCEHVFISHGHLDHIGSLFQHASKRDLQKMMLANYYVPSHLVNSLKIIAEQFALMSDKPHLKKLNIIGTNVGDYIELPWGRHVKIVQTFHRVPSQGFIIYETRRQIKSDFKNVALTEYGKLIKEGFEIWDDIDYPEIAYLGDTLSDAFRIPVHPDLLQVKLLITEATYLEQSNSIAKARERGHTHLFEIFNEPEHFKNVESIFIMHFSDRYSSKDVNYLVYQNMPKELKGKIYVATTAQKVY